MENELIQSDFRAECISMRKPKSVRKCDCGIDEKVAGAVPHHSIEVAPGFSRAGADDPAWLAMKRRGCTGVNGHMAFDAPPS